MGKAVTFMLFLWFCIGIAGSVVAGGQVDFVATTLTVAIDEDDDVITVSSTEGFPSTGVIVIEDEHIGYSHKTSTVFYGTVTAPLVRGAQDTVAVSHSAGTFVTTVAGSMLGMSAAYNVVALTDVSGPRAVVVVPLALLRLLGSLFNPHLEFLGTNLQILTWLWIILAIGILTSLAVQLFGR